MHVLMLLFLRGVLEPGIEFVGVGEWLGATDDFFVPDAEVGAVVEVVAEVFAADDF